MLKRRLLHLLEKLLSQTQQLQKNYKPKLKYTDDYWRRLCVIKKVLEQEKLLFQGDKVNNRIVSVSKDYLRPIARGKETRSVEFGAKLNNIQIDGISFIEHLSFKAFNEGTRLKDCIRLQHLLHLLNIP